MHHQCLLIDALDLGPAIVMKQDLLIGIALLPHDGSTDLAQAHAMAPPFSVEAEARGRLLHVEGRAVQMGIAECAADFQLLADGEGLLRSDYFQLPDAAALASF